MDNVMQYKNHFGSVDYSNDDGVFYGRVLGINDLVSFEGASVQEVRVAFEEAIDDYLDMCAASDTSPEST